MLCTPVYVSRVQRDIGVLSVMRVVRQDFVAKNSASKIQAAWRERTIPDTVDGAFSSWYGYHPNACATKIQAMIRGHQTRAGIPMVRMTRWIVDNLLEPKSF